MRGGTIRHDTSCFATPPVRTGAPGRNTVTNRARRFAKAQPNAHAPLKSW
jgi:hypothetical protein